MNPKDLKKLRAEKKLSVKQLAEIVGVSHRTVEDWEQGRRKIKGAAKKMLDQLNNPGSSPGL